MKIIRPLTLTDAMMAASNVAETDGTAGAWAVGTPYTVGQTVRVVTAGVHKIYECLTNVTGGSSPEVDVLAAVPKWLFVSATNRWKPFDVRVGSQGVQATSITYTITPGEIVDSMAFLNMDAVTVRVVSTDPVEGVVYDETIDLISTVITGSSGIYDWYSYFFSSRFRKTDVTLFDIPPYLNTVFTITITYAGGTAKIGGIVMGVQAEFGGTQYGASIGIHDYSIYESDPWGVLGITERAFSKKMSCDIWVPDASVDDVYNLLASYRATLLVFAGTETKSSMIIYGKYNDFGIVISYPDYSVMSMEISGLT